MSTILKKEHREYSPQEWEKVGCPICGGHSSKIYERFGNKLQYTYRKCLNCKNVFLSPRPIYDEEFVHTAYEFYAEEFTHYNKGFNDTEVKKVIEKIKYEVNEISSFCEKQNNLLDVGCEAGRFLLAAKSKFDNVYGLEVSEHMAAFAENEIGVKVYREKFEDLPETLKFDCIHMSHVIEHIPNPNLWLMKTKKILNENGILVINVPNIYSANRVFKLLLKKLGLKKNRWESWRTPDHLYEPSIPAMLYLFKLNNVRILNYYTYSNKNLTSKGLLSYIIHRLLKIGNNIRFYVSFN